MKKALFVLFLAASLSSAAWAQVVTADQVPTPVKQALQKLFSDAKSVEWKIGSDKNFEAEFTLKSIGITVKFDPTGKWLETETQIASSEVPPAVLAALGKKFKSYKIVETQSLRLDDDPKIIYEIHLDNDQEILKILLYADGTIFKQSAKPKKKNDQQASSQARPAWTDNFRLEECTLSTTGRNSYFILEPGYQLVLEGKEGKKAIRLEITVLAVTKKIGNVETRVVEEKETADGKLTEISRNYFAICAQTKDIFYFGEDVDVYKDGKIANHEGAWLAYQGKNQPGLMMPGTAKVGTKHYQEIAPGVAMDRAKIVSKTESLQTPAGLFKNCLKVEETTPLEPAGREYKIYAPGIGLIKDGEFLLTKSGKVNIK